MSDGNTAIQVSPVAEWPRNTTERAPMFNVEDEMTVRQVFADAANAVVNASQLRREVDQLRQDLADMRDTIGNLVRERAEAIRERDIAQDKYNVERGIAERRLAELDTMRDDRDLARMERDDWQAKHKTVEGELASVCSNRDHLVVTNTALQDWVRTLEAQNATQADTIMRAYEWADQLRESFGMAVHPPKVVETATKPQWEVVELTEPRKPQDEQITF